MATGINRAKLSADDSLIETIGDLQRESRDIKQAQLIGADNILIDGIAASTSITLSAGTIAYISFNVTPSATRAVNNINMWNPSLRIRVDTDSTNYTWPHGSSLVTDQILLLTSTTINRGYSVDSTGRQTFTFLLQNIGSLSHTYYLQAYFYKFATTVTTGSGA